MKNFEIGDRVVCINDDEHAVDSGNITVGMTGTIRCYDLSFFENDDEGIGIEWDEKTSQYMHNLNGCIDNEHGWYVREEAIALLDDNTSGFETNGDISDLL